MSVGMIYACELVSVYVCVYTMYTCLCGNTHVCACSCMPLRYVILKKQHVKDRYHVVELRQRDLLFEESEQEKGKGEKRPASGHRSSRRETEKERETERQAEKQKEKGKEEMKV